MKNLYDTLREKERHLAQLQREVDALRTAAKILADGNEKPGASLAAAVAPSQPQMVRAVLLDKGAPMHVTKIAEALKKKFSVRLKPLYLTAIIYRAMKAGKLFRKEGPNTFGLLEWPSGRQEINISENLRAAS
jgi:hypothetical protein